MNNLIQQMAAKSALSGKKVLGTDIASGQLIGLAPINFNIAEAIRTLDKVEMFGKGSAYFKVGFVRETIDGFIFKRNGFVAVLALDEKGLELDVLYVNKIPSDEQAHYLIQAAILLVLETEFKTLNWKNEIASIQSLNLIRFGTDEAVEFSRIVRMIENSISAGIFNVFDFGIREDLEEYDVKNVIANYRSSDSSYEDDDTDEFDSDEFVEFDEKEEDTKVEEKPVKEEEKQISLFDAESETDEKSDESEIDDDEEFDFDFDEDDETNEAKETETLEKSVENFETQSDLTDEGEVTIYQVSDLLKKMKKQGEDLKSLSEKTGVSKATLSTIQTLSRKNIKQSTLKQIVSALGDKTVEAEGETTTLPPLANEGFNTDSTPTAQQEEVLNEKFKQLNKEFNDASKNPQITFNMDEFFSRFSQILAEAISQGFKPVMESPKVEKEEAVIDMDQLREARPNFFDDTWIDEIVKTFSLTAKDRDDILSFRKDIRNWLIENHPEAIMEVEPNFDYLGYDEPVETIVDAVLEDLNLIFKGEAGAGKTTAVQSGSCLFNLPLFTINGSDESNIETIVGFKEIEDGKIIFKEGRLIKAMIVGGIFYGDEANMIRPNILAIINGALDHRRELYNEFVGKRIKAAKFFRAMFSINEDYEDTREMNKATLDRSIAFEMSYMTIDQLKDLLRRLDSDMSERDIRMLAQIATALQEGVRSEVISPEVASIRNIIFLQKMIRRRSYDKALKRIIHKYKKEERSAIVGVLSGVDRLGISAENILSAV